MIVYVASDLHGYLPDVPSDADLVLLAGDICPDFGSYQLHAALDTTGGRQFNWLDTEFRQWLDEQPGRKVATWGNHDFVGEKFALVDTLHLPWTLLIDQEVTVDGYRIWGTPWVPNLPRWAFSAREEVLRARADYIPEDIDILMSHGPPYGIADRIPGGSKYGNVGAEHVGDSTLNDAIKRVRPTFFVCGHIHEGHGFYEVPHSNEAARYVPRAIEAEAGENFEHRSTLVVNCAAVDELYDLREQPFTRILI